MSLRLKNIVDEILSKVEVETGKVEHLIRQIKLTGNIHGRQMEVEDRYSPWLIYPGCDYRADPNLADILVMFMNKFELHLDYWLLKKDLCCGLPMRLLGAEREYIEWSRKVNEVYSAYDRIVTVCPRCYVTLRENIGKKVVHMIDMIPIFIEGVKLKSLKARVAVHDPCSLAKTGQIKLLEKARLIIECIPEIKLVELEHNRENTICCGAAAGMLEKLGGDTSESHVEKIVEEAKRVKADYIITLCPSCYKTMKQYYRCETIETLLLKVT